MKKLFKYTFLLALGALVSCTEEYEYDGTGAWNATENYSNIAFDKASEEIELEPTADTKYEFTMTRTNTAEEAIVPFVIEENTDDVFTISEVKFAAGDSVATGVVSFDAAEIGKPYTLKLAVTDPNFVSDYSKGTIYSLTINRVKWNPAGFVIIEGQRYDGYAMYTEDIASGLFNTEDLTYPVMVQERDDMPGYFRVINAYGEAWPYNAEGDYDPTVDSYIFIDATDPEKVFIPKSCVQATDWGYGNFIIHSLAGYYLAKNDAETAAGYFGTYKNGKITFPASSLLFGMVNYNNAGLYTSNNDGNFALVLDPTLDPYKASIETDFEWEALYNGAFTSEQLNGTGSATLYQGTCVANTDACDSVFAAEYGTAYCIESPYAEGYNLFFSVLDGKVKILEGYELQSTGMGALGVEVFAKINQGLSSFSANEVVLNITFQNADGSIVYGTANEVLSNITYTPIGLGEYSFVHVLSAFKLDPIKETYVFSKRDDKENVYAIENWGGGVLTESGVTFEFIWDKTTNKCQVPTQPAGGAIYASGGINDDIYISDVVYYTGGNNTYEQFPCYYDADTKTFNFTVLYHDIIKGSYYAQPCIETFVVEFDESESAAKAIKQTNNWELLMRDKVYNIKSLNWKNPFVGTKVNFKSLKTVNGPVF